MREISEDASGCGRTVAQDSSAMFPVPQTRLFRREWHPSGDEALLVRAFESFSDAAGTLERSYSELQTQVGYLRKELEDTNRDLTSSLEENQRMRHRLKRILEGLPCGVLVSESDGTITTCNPEATRLIELNVQQILPGELLQMLPVRADESLEIEQSSETKRRWVAVRRAQLGSEDGCSSIFIFQDITALKQLEQEREVLRRREALAQMSAALAHEIRNPLGSLELFAGLLAESGLGPQQNEWLEHVQAGLRTLAATVNNILHFHSQPQPGLLPTNLGELLNGVMQFLQPVAARSGVALECEAQLEGVKIDCDRHRVEQVFLNLALNSFRFMPDGGHLQFSGRVVGDEAQIEVSDSGPGIAPEDREQVFEAGFSTEPGRAGLGLAVSKTIMEQHRGSIAVTDSAEGGTKFFLQFPLARESR